MSNRSRGHCASTSRRVLEVDDDDDDAVILEVPKAVTHYLEILYEKKGPKREEALLSIIEAFTTNNVKQEIVENKFATFLYRFLNCIKKGSAKEIHLASHAIGLLAVTIGYTDDANEIYRESLPLLTQALKSGTKNSKILESLALVTFFGASDSKETERAMQIIWKFIFLDSGSDVIKRKQSALMLAVAITAWSFLLSTINRFEISYIHWKGAISCLLKLLEEDDELVCVAAGEALAVIVELESLDKFWDEAKDSSYNLIHERAESKYSFVEKLIKDNIINQLQNLSIKARNESSNENYDEDENSDKEEITSKDCKANWDVLMKYFKDDNCPQTSMRIGGHKLTLSSWSQKIQLNFMKHFLGEEGFVKHMLKNQILHELFKFMPYRQKSSSQELYVPTVDKVVVRYVLPGEGNPNLMTKAERKKASVLRNAIIDKAQTQLRNKNRKLSSKATYMVDDGHEL